MSSLFGNAGESYEVGRCIKCKQSNCRAYESICYICMEKMSYNSELGRYGEV